MRLIVILDINPDEILDGGDTNFGIAEAVKSVIETAEDCGESHGISVAEVIEPDHDCLEYLNDPDPICVAMNAQKIGSYVTELLKQ
jgi:hypothetical protein